MATPQLCAAPGCGKPARQNRYSACSMHEARMRRGGSFEPRQPKKSIDDLLCGRKKFGHWIVLGEGDPYRRPTADGKPHPDGVVRTAQCVCDCGTGRDIAIQTLKQGRSNHCGCRNGEMNAELHGIHLLSGTPIYKSWASLKARCLNPNNADYPDYGGMGITVCDRWRDSFEAFYEDMGPRPEGSSIDRIDVNGNYEPGNCRWATGVEQAQNKRETRWVSFRGEKLAMIEACRRAGLSRTKYKVIHARVHRRGMTFEQAMAMEGIAT